MALSRHFYSIDEVQCALMHTTSRNLYNESVFWCKELLLSGCIAETISVLFQSWLWNTGPLRAKWLIDAWNTLTSDEVSEYNIVLSAYQLSNINYKHRDSSLWNILLLTGTNPNKMPDRITKKIPKSMPSDFDSKEKYFVSAMYQNKARCAWWISQFIETERVWELLKWYSTYLRSKYDNQYTTCRDALYNYQMLLGYKSEEYDKITRCVAILLHSIPYTFQDSSFKDQVADIDIDTSKFYNQISSHIGYKSSRLFSIPSACLYASSLRGRMRWTHNNHIQLNNIEKYLVECPFWNEELTKYASISEGDIQWNSYDSMEEFYNKYFPDDIPDEWDMNEKNKSHGDGLLGPVENLSLKKLSRTLLGKAMYYTWGFGRDINACFETILDTSSVDINGLDCIIRVFKSPVPLSEEDLKKLDPVRKILCRP
jgi:hypothetical protein